MSSVGRKIVARMKEFTKDLEIANGDISKLPKKYKVTHMTDNDDIRECFAKRKEGYVPNKMAKDAQGTLWEFISYPYHECEEDVTLGFISILARRPNDPDTMQTFSVTDLTP